jgi:hypothetical protein
MHDVTLLRFFVTNEQKDWKKKLKPFHFGMATISCSKEYPIMSKYQKNSVFRTNILLFLFC